MGQAKLNVEYTELDGIYSIKLGNKVVDIDQKTFNELTTDTNNTYNEEEYVQAYQNFDTSFYSANSSEW